MRRDPCPSALVCRRPVPIKEAGGRENGAARADAEQVVELVKPIPEKRLDRAVLVLLEHIDAHAAGDKNNIQSRRVAKGVRGHKLGLQHKAIILRPLTRNHDVGRVGGVDGTRLLCN